MRKDPKDDVGNVFSLEVSPQRPLFQDNNFYPSFHLSLQAITPKKGVTSLTYRGWHAPGAILSKLSIYKRIVLWT